MKSVFVASALLAVLCTSGLAHSAQVPNEDGNAASPCGKAAGESSGDKHARPNLIQIPVSVTDQAGSSVPNLTAEDFTIAEDARPQQICRVSSDDAPWTIGFVVDNSGSTANQLSWELGSIAAFLKFANPQNEYLVVETSPVRLISGFTPLSKELAAALSAVEPGHGTALLDAIELSVDKMKAARYSRRALVVVSDAGDNSSAHTQSDVRSALLRSSVQVYVVGSPKWESQAIESRVAIREMQAFTSETGGVLMAVTNAEEFAQAGAAVSTLLRRQYLLSYDSNNTRPDGKWRKVKVRMSPLPGLPHATVYAPAGYYGPAR